MVGDEVRGEAGSSGSAVLWSAEWRGDAWSWFTPFPYALDGRRCPAARVFTEQDGIT